MTTRGVLCVGRLYADLIFTGVPRLPTPGTEVFSEGVSVHAGGGAAITAAYLSASGRPASLLAHLPGAPFDDAVKAELVELGVDLRFTNTDPTRQAPQMTVAIVTEGDRAFLTHNGGAAFAMPAEATLRGAGIRHLHIGELRTLIDAPDLLPTARDLGLTVSLDCGWDDGFDAGIGELIRQVDVFLPNSDEMNLLAGLGVGDALAPLTAVKCGAEGARLLSGESRPARRTKVVDTTGAGDAFNGGFLNAWLDGQAPVACLEAGIACGALAVSFAGGPAGAMALRGPSGPLAAQ